jgi:hypothetical protein
MPKAKDSHYKVLPFFESLRKTILRHTDVPLHQCGINASAAFSIALKHVLEEGVSSEDDLRAVETTREETAKPLDLATAAPASFHSMP